MTDMREFIRTHLGESYVAPYDALTPAERADYDAQLRKSWAYQAGEIARARDNLFEAMGLFRLLDWMSRHLCRLPWVRKP